MTEVLDLLALLRQNNTAPISLLDMLTSPQYAEDPIQTGKFPMEGVFNSAATPLLDAALGQGRGAGVLTPQAKREGDSGQTDGSGIGALLALGAGGLLGGGGGGGQGTPAPRLPGAPGLGGGGGGIPVEAPIGQVPSQAGSYATGASLTSSQLLQQLLRGLGAI